jgi:hypothetical protein
MIYLASPYSHSNPLVSEARFDAACLATVSLVKTGRPVFAPIVMGHPLVRFGLPSAWSFWQALAQVYLQRCDELVVLQIDGWQESKGVQAEIALASTMGKRIEYLQPENDGVSLSSRTWHLVAPVAHVADTAKAGPSERTPGQPPTSPVLRDDVANEGRLARA